MTIYAPQTLGTNISQFVGRDDAQDEAIRSQERGSTAPTTLVYGLLWDSTNTTNIAAAGGGALTEAILRYTMSGWEFLLDPSEAQINAGGTVAFAADQAMGGNKITDLDDGSADDHAANCGQVMLLNGANAMAADLAMGSHKITGLAAPSASDDAARKVDVDGAGKMYYNNIRDVAGTGKPVLIKESSGDTANFIECGFKPLRVIVKIKGEFCKVSDNSSVSHSDDDVFDFHLWPDDATGDDEDFTTPYNFGYTGTLGSSAVFYFIEYKTSAPKGLYISFRFSSSGNIPSATTYCRCRTSADNTITGSVHVQAIGEVA